MPMMTSQIFKSVDFPKTQKSRYLENETLFFLQIKKFINYTSRATLLQKSFVAKVTFNPLSAKFIKWSNTLKQFVGKLPTNCLSVFDHFVGLALKGLKNCGTNFAKEAFLYIISIYI